MRDAAVQAMTFDANESHATGCGHDAFREHLGYRGNNKVLLDVMAIDREKERLSNENSDLRSILKQYLDGISVNEDVINNANPLLVVNHKTNIAMPSAHARCSPVRRTSRGKPSCVAIMSAAAAE